MDSKFPKEIYILGVGNNTPVLIDLVEACGYKVGGLYHYDHRRNGEVVFGHVIRGTHEELFHGDSIEGKLYAVSVGDNRIRHDLSQKLRSRGGIVPTLIHPHALVSPYAEIGEGVIIHAGAILQASCKVGRDTVVSYQVSVAHSSEVKHACFLSTKSTIGAYITLAEYAFVGMGAVLVSGKLERAGVSSVIGAGSVVISDVADSEVVCGNPARKLR